MSIREGNLVCLSIGSILISPRAQLILTLFLSQLLRVVAMLVMARFIAPAEYGVYTLFIAASGVLVGLGDFAIPSSLVQARDISEKVAYHTALLLGGVLYIIYGLATICVGTYMGYVRHNPHLFWISLIVAITNLLIEFYSIQLSCLNRRMQFRRESLQNLIFAVSQTITGVGMALTGWGIYAIVTQQLVGQLIASMAIMRHCPLEWPREFSMTVARRFLVMGGKVSLALYVSTQFTSIITWRFAKIGGDSLVGSWNRATSVYSLFTQNFMSAFDRVFFTSLCNANDQHRVKLVVEGLGIYNLVAGLITAILFLCAGDMVNVVLGPKYHDSIPILQLLALSVPAFSFYGIAYPACYGINRVGLIFTIQMLAMILAPIMLIKFESYFWPTAVYGIARYFNGLGLMIWVLVIMKVSIPRAFATSLISMGQASLAMGYGIISYGPITHLAEMIARWLPDQIGGHPLPIENIFRIFIISFAVFMVYLMLTLILQPAMGSRLLQLTARKKPDPAVVGGVNDITCSAS